jgi:hypothetical protein
MGASAPWFDVSAAALKISRRAVKRARLELVGAAAWAAPARYSSM